MTGENPDRVRLSGPARTNAALRTAWAGYYADRGLLLLSFGWLAIRWFRRQTLLGRPEEMYDPITWLGAWVFPEHLPGAWVWYGLAALMATALVACLVRPRFIVARVVVAGCALLLMAPEFSYGKIEHVNHLFLLAHVYAIFLPAGRPSADELGLQAEATRWYQSGLLFIYTMAGLWKFVDMTLRNLLKPEMTWLHPDAMPFTSVLSYRIHDLPLTIPHALEGVRWLIPAGYVVLAFIFAAAMVAPFRRPLLLLVLPTILAFHLSNVFTLYVIFVSTCAVALVLFAPYDLFVPAIRRQLTPAAATAFTGSGFDARYTRRYSPAEEDVFEGFYAYRARLTDRSRLLAALLYYPGVAWLGEWLLQRAARRQHV